MLPELGQIRSYAVDAAHQHHISYGSSARCPYGGSTRSSDESAPNHHSSSPSSRPTPRHSRRKPEKNGERPDTLSVDRSNATPVDAVGVTIAFSMEKELAMKLWLDDTRDAPRGWVHVFWPDEAISWLKCGGVTHISLDHDLGDDTRGTGYDVLLWIEQESALHGFQPPSITIHSANVSARDKMRMAVVKIMELHHNRKT